MKIGNVSFINSYPFQYALEHYAGLQVFKMVPSAIAQALENDSIDVGLVPIATFLKHPDWKIVSDYCIGARGDVDTVLLLSKKPIKEVKTIYYDPDSRSSNMLAKVLCAKYWEINVTETAFETADACVMIGDKTFSDFSIHFPYRYDLAMEWFRFQKMPFVFAVWVSNKTISKSDSHQINEIMEFGVNHIEEAVSYFSQQLLIPTDKALHYLKDKISFQLNSEKKEAIERFKQFVFDLNLI